MSGSDAMAELTCDEVREMAGAFVLGALEPSEDAAVRAHLASCGDAHDEIAELGGVLPALAASVPVVEPPAGLKARIMAAAAADLEQRSAATGLATHAPATQAPEADAPVPPIAFPTPSARQARRTRSSAGMWALRIAAVIAIVALGGWNLLLQGQLNAAKSYQQGVAAVLETAAKPGSVTAILTADGGAGSGLGAVSATGEVTLAMHDLARTTGQTVYEAWVIGGDGVPIPLGSFTVGSSGTGYLQGTGLPAANDIVLAVTLEPAAGAKTPTPPIISKGVARTTG